MHHAFLDLLCTALVPELSADVTTSAACYVHFILILVAALGAGPHKLTVLLANFDFTIPPANLAIITFCVEFRIHDIVINKFDNLQNRFQIVLHVGDLHVADGPAGGESLELGFEFQLFKGVDGLRHMNVVAVGDVPFIGHALDNAEPTLQAFGKFISGRFKGRAINAEADGGLL